MLIVISTSVANWPSRAIILGRASDSLREAIIGGRGYNKVNCVLLIIDGALLPFQIGVDPLQVPGGRGRRGLPPLR